jgi:hypothetical protein
MEARIPETIRMLHSLGLTAEFRKNVCDQIYILNNQDGIKFRSSVALLEAIPG